MPRTLWTRRPSTTNPRPAGRRRWARLRRGGAFARRVLWVSHGRRASDRLAREQYVSSRRLTPGTDLTGVGRSPAVPALPTGATGSASATAGEAGADLPDTGGLISLLPGERTPSRRLRFLVVNLFTLTNLGLGALAIVLATAGDLRTAALCLLICVACDGMDGMLARRLGVASPFGAQLDSLADMCAFGIAAPVLVYAAVSDAIPFSAAVLACVLVAGCAAIRLARFNVSSPNGRFFTGVPTTLVAGVLALAVVLALPPVGLFGGAVLLAFAMVSSFPYAKLAQLLRLPPWVWLAPLAVALVDVRLAFLVLVTGYLASGPVLWLHRRYRMAPAASLDSAAHP